MKTKSLVAVVDDEDSVCRALGRLIRSAGLDVVTFNTGKSFLESLSTKMPDCLVLDLHMSELNGFDVQERLVQAKVRVPVVIITGHDTRESRERAMANGGRVYIVKPVDDKALLLAIEEAIGTTSRD